MRKKKRLVISCLLTLAVALCSTGCGKGKDAEETTLYIQKNNTVVGAIVEDWTDDFLDESELKKKVDQEIEAFLADNSEASVKLEKFEIEDKKAKVNISYDSIESYAAFNSVTAFMGTVAQAQKEGFAFEGEFASVKQKPSITLEEIDGSKDYQVLILSEKQKVSFAPGILYVSDNVTVEDDGTTAQVDADSGHYAYIIYK